MRRWFLAAAGAATLLTAAAMTPAGALPLGLGAMRPAAEAVNPVDKAACWRWGWHGWGWYPCWGGGDYDGGYYGRPYYYRHWGPGYGWRHHHDEDEEDDEHHYWRR